MCNLDEVLEVINNYVGELRCSMDGYCVTPDRQGYFKSNCDKCSEKYWDEYQEELERKCGVLDES